MRKKMAKTAHKKNERPEKKSGKSTRKMNRQKSKKEKVVF
jgi:hypothetical protein